MPLATPEELAKYPPPALPGWIRHPEKYGFPDWKPTAQDPWKGGALIRDPWGQIEFKRATKSGKPGETYVTSNVGPQTWCLMTPYQETVVGGSRGGGKSLALIAWMVMGYHFLHPQDPAHYASILEPSFRGLLLRKEYKSMAEFLDEAWDFYGPLGATKKDDPMVFTFKSGAKIYTSHLGDKNAFEQFRGWGLSRIGIEELTQIEDESSYKKLLGSLRGKKQVRVHHTAYGRKQFPALPSQVMSTTNPDGPGTVWVRKRFIKVIDAKGKYIPWNTPMRDPISKATRIFIPMARKENPFLRDNAEYESMLMSQDEITRKQWVEGLWESSGTYFTEWRPDGPIGEEQTKYPWARHVIEKAELRDYWFRGGGGDWGFSHPAVFHKFCRNEKDGRIHLYDELTLRQCGSFEMGVHLANWWIPDLEGLPDKTVTIAFSPDAFSKTDATRTKAEQVADGIKSVLGPYGAFMLKYSDEERALMVKDPGLAQRMFERRRMDSAKGQFCIVLKAANTDRVAGWSYMRELMRFRPVVQESEAQLKERLTKTFGRGGEDAYEKELSKVKRRNAEENLPRLQIWKRCHGLIRCMEEAIRKEEKPEDVEVFNAVEGQGGDDPLDSARYTCMNYKDIENSIPKHYYVSEKMEEIQSQYEKNEGERLTDPTRLIMVQLTQAANFDRTHVPRGGTLNLPRASSTRHRVRQPNQHRPFLS